MEEFLAANVEEEHNIFIAAGDGQLAEVQAFVSAGISVNSQDEYGYSPL